nr:FG-GAP-like repeat-containing protein [Myxococcota bacterium]
TAFCAASACGIACDEGFGDCNGDPADGCETALDTATSCGGCGIVCSYANAAGVCTAGACELDACAAGFDDCNGAPADGCEVDLGTTLADCGACGNTCPSGQVCSAGMCAASCRPGLSDCSGSCRDLANDPTSCGACGTTCPAGPGATAFCSASTCGIVCAPGRADCNGDPIDGCEVDLTSTTSDCGACGAACTLPNATEVCTASLCQVDSCDAGFDDCNAARIDGCEASLSTDSANCGVCGSACPSGQRCSMGMCLASCAAPLTACGLECVNAGTDPANCGGCGMACPDRAAAAEVCAAGSCAFVCDAGFADCDLAGANGCEIDTRSDETSCGGCGRACGTGEECLAGTCALAPRPLAPIFSASVTQRRPTIEVELAPGTSSARIELCADRACGTVLQTFDTTGASGRPTANLPAGIVWWRAYSTSGGAVASSPSTTWYFVVPPSDHGTVDTYYWQRGDLNGDGFADVVIGSRNGSTATVSYGSAAGVSAAPTVTITTTPSSALSSPQYGDFNGDGYSDLWLSTMENLRGFVYFGSPTGISTTPSQTFAAPAGASGGWFGYRVSGAGDLNHDGYADLVLTHWNAGPARVIAYYGSATGLGGATVIASNPNSGFAYRVAGVGDLNGDRFADVAVGNPHAGSNVHVYYGSSTGLPTTAALVIAAPGGLTNWGYVVSATDMNGDGYSDLLAANTSGQVHFYPGSAMGVSSTPAAGLAMGGGGYVVGGIGDANADGYDDALFGDGGGTARILLGGPAGLPGAVSATTTTGGGRGVTSTGDVNGDGFSDWVGANGSNMAAVWHGQMSIPASPAPARTWTVSASGYGYPLN